MKHQNTCCNLLRKLLLDDYIILSKDPKLCLIWKLQWRSSNMCVKRRVQFEKVVTCLFMLF